MLVKTTVPQSGLPTNTLLEVVHVSDNGRVSGYKFKDNNDWTLYYAEKGNYVNFTEQEESNKNNKLISANKLLEHLEQEENLARMLPNRNMQDGALFVIEVIRIRIESGQYEQ